MIIATNQEGFGDDVGVSLLIHPTYKIMHLVPLQPLFCCQRCHVIVSTFCKIDLSKVEFAYLGDALAWTVRLQ